MRTAKQNRIGMQLKYCSGCKRKVRFEEVEMVPSDDKEHPGLVPMHVIDDPDPQLCGPVEGV